MTVGVGVKTRNRRAVFNHAIAAWRRHLPPGTPLVVVDDASDEPVPDIDGVTVIRHEHRLGVAMAQNTLIEALMDMGVDHLFLADDDIAPICPGFWQPYVDSPEPHLSFQGPRRRPKLGTDVDEKHWAAEFPRGWMLYCTREVIDTVGGMDPCYGLYGGEHATWQRRIHDAGLTRWPYADVIGSDRLWRARPTVTTVGQKERQRMLAATDVYWRKQYPSAVPFRHNHRVQDYSLGPEISGSYYPVLQHVLDLHPVGTAVEFGVGAGHSAKLIAAQLPLVGFDSGMGLPESWRPEYPAGSLAYPLPCIDNATMVEGWFADTLPGYDFGALGYIGLVHFDADVYSSTATALEHIGPYLQLGTYCIFDEFIGPHCEQHEQRAWREFADANDIGWTVVGHWYETWAIRITGRSRVDA